jgi:hypothetical protein
MSDDLGQRVYDPNTGESKPYDTNLAASSREDQDYQIFKKMIPEIELQIARRKKTGPRSTLSIRDARPHRSLAM